MADGNIFVGFFLSIVLLAVGIIKGALWLPVAVLVLSVTHIVIMLIWVFPNIFRTYRALFKTTRIGPNLKVLWTTFAWLIWLLMLGMFLIFTPILSVMICFFVVVGMTVAGLGVYWSKGMAELWGCNEKCVWISGYKEIISFNPIGQFWKANATGFESYVDRSWVDYTGKTFDIRILDTIIGVFFSLLAMPIHLVVAIIGAVIFYIPHILVGYYYLFYGYFSSGGTLICLLFIPLLFGIACLIPIYTVGVGLMIIAAPFTGLYVGVLLYQEGFLKGLKHDIQLCAKYYELLFQPIKSVF